MEPKNYTGLIPEQRTGKEIIAEAGRSFENAEQARRFYAEARKRLLSVSEWGRIAAGAGTRFVLTDKWGEEVGRLAEKGDHFRIDIKGPGSQAGEGYDWVRVEDIREINSAEVDSVAILVRPAQNPKTGNPDIAHFYSEAGTSTFVVTREHHEVTASIYDRNIEVNQESGELPDKLRNALVGLGAKHGFSKLQWKALAGALVGEEK